MTLVTHPEHRLKSLLTNVEGKRIYWTVTLRDSGVTTPTNQTTEPLTNLPKDGPGSK